MSRLIDTQRDANEDVIFLRDDVEIARVDKAGNIATKGAVNGGSIAALQRGLLVPAASRVAPSYGTTSALSDGTTQGGTSRVQHIALVSTHSLVLVWGNFYNNLGTETVGPNDITVAGCIDDGARTFPVTFNGGLQQVTIKPGCLAYSDPISYKLTKGDTFYTRSFVSVGAGLKFPRGADAINNGASTNEGHNYPATASTGADLTVLGSLTTGLVNTHNTERVYQPCAILGRQTTPGASSIAIVGDSIAAGSGDTGTFADWGYLKRALANLYCFQAVAYPSETVDAWMQQGGLTRFRRASLLEMANVSHIICQLGINSIGNGAVQTNLQLVWAFLASFGVPVYQCTITPRTTSTDAWATLGNQTVTANEAARVALNAYIRSKPSPLTGYFEAADLAESARDSGKWRVDLGTPTTDGIHPAAVVAAAMAAGVTLTSFTAST